MEKYVMDHNVGADAWRRTGVLTFNGNARLKKSLNTYRISLVSKYHIGTARNNRRLSSAKITTRRARKGFCLKYNPDSHWSAALHTTKR